MFKNFIKFIKYNNATVLILIIVLIAGTGVFAQTETGQDFIGQKQTKIKGIDNTLLLEADLDNFKMDFEIKEIKKDEKYYYIKYIYYDLIKNNNVWKYQWNEKIKKISLKLKKDLGKYLAEEFTEEYQARIKELKQRQEKAKKVGKQKITEITEYNGLIGETLKITGKIFTKYKPVKIRQIPSPEIPTTTLIQRKTINNNINNNISDNLTDVYNNYINKNDPDSDDIFGISDNCPNDYNPEQKDTDSDGIGDVCDLTPEGESIDITTATSCSIDSLDLCDEDSCSNLKLYWDDGFCTTTATTTDLTTSTDSSCNIDNLDLCDNEANCVSTGGFWHDEICNIEKEVVIMTCDIDSLDLCDKSSCFKLKLYWDDGICTTTATTTNNFE